MMRNIACSPHKKKERLLIDRNSLSVAAQVSPDSFRKSPKPTTAVVAILSPTCSKVSCEFCKTKSQFITVACERKIQLSSIPSAKVFFSTNSHVIIVSEERRQAACWHVHVFRRFWRQTWVRCHTSISQRSQELQ